MPPCALQRMEHRQYILIKVFEQHNEDYEKLYKAGMISELQRKFGAGSYRQLYFFIPVFLNFAAEDKQLTHTKEYLYGREQQ